MRSYVAYHVPATCPLLDGTLIRYQTKRMVGGLSS